MATKPTKLPRNMGSNHVEGSMPIMVETVMDELTYSPDGRGDLGEMAFRAVYERCRSNGEGGKFRFTLPDGPSISLDVAVDGRP